MLTFTIVVQLIDQPADTYTTRSTKEAYRIYDRAIEQGYAVLSFTSSSGLDYADRKSA